MKYIIELEKIEGTDLYKAKGTNTLVFDEYSIKNILKPLPDEPETEWSKVSVDTPKPNPADRRGTMKYKVGDRVKIKDIDALAKCEFVNSKGNMLCYAGTVMTILDVGQSAVGDFYYLMEEDIREYCFGRRWTDDMIEGLAEPESLETRMTKDSGGR